MSDKRYPVHLSTEQRHELQQLIHTGKSTAHQQMAAWVLLKADESNENAFTCSQTAQALSGNYPTERPFDARSIAMWKPNLYHWRVNRTLRAIGAGPCRCSGSGILDTKENQHEQVYCVQEEGTRA